MEYHLVKKLAPPLNVPTITTTKSPIVHEAHCENIWTFVTTNIFLEYNTNLYIDHVNLEQKP